MSDSCRLVAFVVLSEVAFVLTSIPFFFWYCGLLLALYNYNGFVAPRLIFFWYCGLLLALYNYNGFVAPRLNLYNFWFSFHSVCFYVLGVFPAARPHTVHLVRTP